MPTAIVTGVTGQDGSYLAEFLFAKGYRVIGAVRDVLEGYKLIPASMKNQIELVPWKMMEQHQIEDVVACYDPEELYNFAACSSGAGMFDDSIRIGETNGLAVARMLEAIRRVNPNTRFCQASSSEMFGDVTESPQSEQTAFNPRTPYGAAKLYAHSMVRIYREHYGLFACSAILFNHESPRRGLCFVTRKITHAAAKIKLGLSNELRLGDIDARRDWGFAADYVRAMWLMMQQSQPDDYVLSTGETHTVREFCECAFEYLGLNYREYVREGTMTARVLEHAPLVGDSGKARKDLAWKPEVGFRSLVKMMVDEDLQRFQNCGSLDVNGRHS